MISTDRKIFEDGSAVRTRQIEYARNWDEVHIIVFTNKTMNFSESGLSSNCFVYPTNSSVKIKYPFDAIHLGQFIIEKRGITNITCQDPFLTAVAGVSLKKNNDVKLEIQLHTDIGSSNYAKSIGNRIRKALALSYLPKADSVRVVSNRIKDYLIGTLNIEQSKITMRPVTVDIECIRNAPIIETADLHKKYPQFNKIILMASRLEKEKNIDFAIRAFAKVIKKMPKTGLVIVGDGSETSKILSTVSKLGIETSVIVEPWANKETLVSYYKTANVFLNTSFFEGYGMALVEAKAAGCKIISTDVGVAKEVGAVIVGYNDTEVADAIIRNI